MRQPGKVVSRTLRILIPLLYVANENIQVKLFKLK